MFKLKNKKNLDLSIIKTHLFVQQLLNTGTTQKQSLVEYHTFVYRLYLQEKSLMGWQGLRPLLLRPYYE